MQIHPTNSAQTHSNSEIRCELKSLKYHTNSHSVLLMTTSGHIIDSAGAFDHFKIGNMSALIAANFMATTELARLIGNQSAFKTCHNNGPDFDIFSFSLTGDFLLTVIFGKTSKVGLVRYYVNQYSKQLINLLVDSEIVFDLSDSHLVSVEDEINQLFGSPNGF